MSASTDITPTIASIFAVVRSKDPHAPTATLFKERCKQYLKVWDGSFARQRYAAGDEMTIADISLYAGWVRVKALVPEVCEGVGNVERWASEMAARPALQRAMQF
jgi:glutathione S-transferase